MSALKRQQGLTLVELMIATALSLTLLAGVLLVFSANKATYNLQNGLSVLQENGRYAIQQIASDIQLAGYGGCISPRVSPAPRIINLVSTNAPKTDFLDGFPDQTFFQGRDDDQQKRQPGRGNARQQAKPHHGAGYRDAEKDISRRQQFQHRQHGGNDQPGPAAFPDHDFGRPCSIRKASPSASTALAGSTMV